MTSNKPNATLAGWPDPRGYRRSVRREFAVYLCGVVLSLMLLTGYVVSRQYVATVTASVEDKLLVQARSYSGPAGKLFISEHGPDVLLLRNICSSITRDNRAALWAGFTDVDGVWIAHTDIRRVAAQESFSLAGSPRGSPATATEVSEFHGDTLLVSMTIAERGVPLGALVIASSTEAIARARRESIRSVAVITIVMILIGLPMTMLVVGRKLRPLQIIARHLRLVNLQSPSLAIPVPEKNEFGFLAATLGALGSRLATAQQELIEKERLSKEIEVAREIQLQILPRDVPRGNDFACAASYRSAWEVGGDYYDFIAVDADHVGFLVADVSGKSLPGMLVMLMTRDIVRGAARNLVRPAELLSEVNRELLPNVRRGTFVTMFSGVLDRATGRFRFASAGHNPLIVISRERGVQLHKTKGFPLGMMPPDAFDRRLEEQEIVLSPGDWLIQYTDGVNEAHSEAGEEFGMDRLLRVLQESRDISPPQLVEAVLAAHKKFVGEAPPYDDLTLLALKWGVAAVDEPVSAGIEVSCGT